MNPLDQLADISTPEKISMWPLAWGYWVVIALVIVTIGGSIYAIVRYKNKRRVKYQTITTLSNIATTDPYFAHKIQVALKNICAHYVPLANTQTLYGREWESFLLSMYTGKQETTIKQAISALNVRMYTKPPKQAGENVAPNADSNTTQNVQEGEQILSALKDLVNKSFPPSKHFQALSSSVSDNKPNSLQKVHHD